MSAISVVSGSVLVTEMCKPILTLNPMIPDHQSAPFMLSYHGSCVILCIHGICQNLIIPVNASHMFPVVREFVDDSGIKGDPLKTHHESVTKLCFK